MSGHVTLNHLLTGCETNVNNIGFHFVHIIVGFPCTNVELENKLMIFMLYIQLLDLAGILC